MAADSETNFAEIADALAAGQVIPYLGPGVLGLAPGGSLVPDSAPVLVQRLTAKVSVPHKIRNNLTAAAQFIENFRHRKTLSALMTEAFRIDAPPTSLHRSLVGLGQLPVIVDAWYDDLMAKALCGRADWGQIQGVSRAERRETWSYYARADGTEAKSEEAAAWATILYKPIGSIAPAQNYIVSDSDYVEVLTEIDIQTPIPGVIQQRRVGRNFLFLGCRFDSQLTRSFARQIMKRSSDRHWAVMSQPLTRNEERFVAEQNIEVLDIALDEFAAFLVPGAAQVSVATA
jgi:SIR2-like domain